jgi:hypothetical protein
MAITNQKPPTLCQMCVIVREQPLMKPTHLVHPVTGDHMLFDVRSEAVCPTLWRALASGAECGYAASVGESSTCSHAQPLPAPTAAR